MKIELTYTKIDDFYIPDLTLGDQPDKPIGRYGELWRTYLQEYHPGTFNRMLLQGTLYYHLAEIDEAAQHRLDMLIPQLAKAAGATEDLKVREPMCWVGLMNSCKAQVDEIIMAELIFS